MIWFISDSHFGHSAIVLYCGRPFKNSDEMDETIIRNWNQIVKPEDTVCHLGDFSLSRSEKYQEYIDALNGKIILIDELLTPDSSRFWPLDEYEKGKSQNSFDKQYVRDYLLSINFNKRPPAPSLPEEVILNTSKKYKEALYKLTGETL